jgi:hypothetical protein
MKATDRLDLHAAVRTQGMPVVVIFLTALIGAILALWLNIRFVKKRIPNWQPDWVVPFVFSVGSFEKNKKELWIERGAGESDADMIVKQQLACLLEMPIGFVVGGILSAFLS